METKLVLVQNDILEALDWRHGVILVLLLSRLEQCFRMSGPVLTWWIRSYLSDRLQSVNVPGGASSNRSIACGVPQGSVLYKNLDD